MNDYEQQLVGLDDLLAELRGERVARQRAEAERDALSLRLVEAELEIDRLKLAPTPY